VAGAVNSLVRTWETNLRTIPFVGAKILSGLRFTALNLPLAVALLTPGLFAGDPPKTPPSPVNVEKVSTYSVLHLEQEYKIMKSDAVAAFEQQLTADHARALKDWEVARKAVLKVKSPFTRARPETPHSSLMKGGFKTQAEAQTYVATLVAQDHELAHPTRPLSKHADGTHKP